MAELKVFDSIDELSQYFADFLSEDLNHKEGKYSLALSGGSTPKQVFNFIAEKYKPQIQWDRIDIYWGDERCVPPDDPESNYKMAYDYLLNRVHIPEKNIYRIRGEENPEKEAERYSRIIKKNLNEKPVFDLIMLGLGEDGHTASIFPDQMDLLTDQKICSTAVHPDSGQKRITLTGTTINNARNIVFIVTGESKSKIISEILNNKEAALNYPAYHIKPEEGILIWLTN